MKKIFFLLYLLLLAFHLVAGEQGWDDAVFYSKPLLLISLILIFLPYPLKKGFNQFSIFILLGLIFSLGGDTLLMFQDQGGFFVYGLSSFLLAHIFYILAFFRTNRKNHEIALIKRQGWVMVLIVAYGFLFFREIKDDLGSMIGPVMIYTMAITLMLLLAANRYKKVSEKSFWFVLGGALLFVASDSILAWNKFVHHLDWSHTLIMSTYGLAQLFIAQGAIIQLEDKE